MAELTDERDQLRAQLVEAQKAAAMPAAAAPAAGLAMTPPPAMGAGGPRSPLPSPADVDRSMQAMVPTFEKRYAVGRPASAIPRTPHPASPVSHRHASFARRRSVDSGTWFFNVRVSVGGLSYTLTRRYRQFQELHASLSALGLSAATLPRFPRKYSYKTQDERFVAKRREELEEYLAAVVADRQLRQCAELHQFLELGLLLGQIERGAGSRGMDRATR